MTAGSMGAMGPDSAAAITAGAKVFKIVDTPTKVDAVSEQDSHLTVTDPETFRGEIEFKKVWFRYPTKPNQWVFKGLDLKINPKDCIAIVGESGSGKSTFINLVMRFYEPDFGDVFIDGKNVKEYNVASLRARMGLVMQEPVLFNYSLTENLLYGKQNASNLEIQHSAKIANATEFIEENVVASSIEDTHAAIYEEFVKPEHTEALKRALNEDGYETTLKDLKKLMELDADKGTFAAIKGAIDQRNEAQRGDLTLSQGYDVFAGIRGSKLSGGQKQRIAIARAVIRQPHILLLDEATSALDENSQK